MLYDNALSLREKNLNTNQPAKNSNLSSSLAFPFVAVAWCCLNTNNFAFAIDFNSQMVDDNFTFTHPDLKVTRDSWQNQPQSPALRGQSSKNPQPAASLAKSSGWLPQIVGLIPESWKNQLLNLSQGWSVNYQSPTTFNSQAVGGSFVQDLTPFYLSQAASLNDSQFLLAKKLTPMTTAVNNPLTTPKVEPQIYQVKAGDTITRIAQKFQVSRAELITLNKIKNSNIIFVNQKLKIPVNQTPSAAKSMKLDTIATAIPQDARVESLNSSVPSAYLADSRLNDRNLAKIESDRPIPISNDQRIAKLRAEIAQMRAQYKAGDSSLTRELPLLSSNTSSNQSQSDQSNSLDPLAEKALALNLPPLPSAEEYLPDAFDGYAWPAQGVLTSGYGWRWGRLHKGIDIAAPVGTPVFAAAAGEVISAGWNSGGYGNLVEVQHLDGSVTLYAHNNRILVSNGQKVSKGEQIAEMGSTGFSTGSHLHFEIHTHNQEVVNPLAFLSPQ